MSPAPSMQDHFRPISRLALTTIIRTVASCCNNIPVSVQILHLEGRTFEMRLRKHPPDFQLFPYDKFHFGTNDPQFPYPSGLPSLHRDQCIHLPHIDTRTAADNIRKLLSPISHLPSVEIICRKVIIVQDLRKHLCIGSAAERLLPRLMPRCIRQCRKIIIILVLPADGKFLGDPSAAFGKSGVAYLHDRPLTGSVLLSA